MTASPRLVSVIIGTRDRPETLRVALASIRALEGPDLKFEILVGDNGTAADTPKVVAEFGGVYGRTETYGCAAARNVAMRKVTGEFVAFLDDDDAWLPGHIRPHIAALDADPELEGVFGQVVSADADLRPFTRPWPANPPTDGDLFTTMMSGYFPQVGATLMRARTVQKYGLMDETLIGDSDWDWQLRVARDHKIGFTPTPCVLFRQRPPGSFNSLQLNRNKYTRGIFLRHALPNRHRWPSLAALGRSYCGAVSTYYDYFIEAAEACALNGDRRGALRAVAAAFWVLPQRATGSLFRRTLRAARARARKFTRLADNP